jgi:hypothetical protein
MRERLPLPVATNPRCRGGSATGPLPAALRARALQKRRDELTGGNAPTYQNAPERKQQREGASATATPRAAACTWLAAICTLAVAGIGNRATPTTANALHDALLYDRDVFTGRPRTAHLSVEIFTAPKPFIGDDAEHQIIAIESWLMLKPRPTVTLLGNTEGCEHIVKQYGLNWLPDIDTTFLGVPLFNAVFAAANSSSADIVVVANADIFLFDDFSYALRKIYRDISGPWLAVGARWDLGNVSARALLPKQGSRPRQLARYRRAILRYARENGTLHTYGGIDVWAWNTKTGAAVYDGFMPHFVFGRGKYDNWFTHEAIAARRRAVIDVSESCTLVHIVHDHHLVSDQTEVGHGTERRSDRPTASRRAFWNDGAHIKFELYINTYLAAAHGSYANQMGTILHTPYKLQSCYESEALCLFRRRRPNACRCEHSPFVPRAMTDPFAVNHSYLVFCGLLSTDQQRMLFSKDTEPQNRYVISGRSSLRDGPSSRGNDIGMSLEGFASEAADSLDSMPGNGHEVDFASRKPDVATGGAAFGLPIVLERLVDVIEHRTGSVKILLVVLNSNHMRLLMNLVCSARRTKVFPHLVIAALDDEMYHFAITRGLAVYLEENSYTSDFDDDASLSLGYGSSAADLHLSARLHIVQRLLRLGREVLYIDVDVFMVRDPFIHVEQSIARNVDVAFLSRQNVGGTNVRNATGFLEPLGCGKFATGVIYARPNERTSLLISNLIGRVQSSSRSDRRAGGKMLDALVENEACGTPGEHGGSGGRRESIDLCIASGDARVGLLPESLFVDGFHMVLADSISQMSTVQVLVHIGGPASVADKLAMIHKVPDLTIFDEATEVCHIPPQHRR